MELEPVVSATVEEGEEEEEKIPAGWEDGPAAW